MIVPFKNLPPESRVWVFPSDRPFREEELGKLKKALTNFLSSWTAHNQELEAGFDLPYNRFIILGLNQEKVQASGCSIDASVHFIQELEKVFELSLLDKMNVTFKQGTIYRIRLWKTLRKWLRNALFQNQLLFLTI